MIRYFVMILSISAGLMRAALLANPNPEFFNCSENKKKKTI